MNISETEAPVRLVARISGSRDKENIAKVSVEI
jgi:hypothetical protein